LNRDEKTGGFSSLGEFLVKVRKACDGEGTPDSRLRKTAGHMEESDDSQGGYLTPELWADEILSVALENSIVRSRATVLKASSDSLKVRTLVDSDRSSNIFGGVSFSWVDERGSKTSGISKPALGLRELTPHKLVGSCWVSNELEDDYGKFGNFMKLSFGRAIRFWEDETFLNGGGAGMPLGVIPAGFTITVTRAALGTLDWTDIAHMAERLLPDSWNRAVWLINPNALDELLESTASAANQVTVWDASRRTIMNRPVIMTENCPDLNTAGDIILADFQHYIIADREMRISASRHVPGSYGFLTDETFWKVVLRVDGQPVVDAAITPRYGANTLSAFVILSTDS